MNTPLDSNALNQLFLEARTFSAGPDPWQDRPVSAELLHQVWDLARMGPTAANMSPARVAFICSADAKAKLGPLMDEGNRAKTLAAPATAILAMDMKFYDELPRLFPHADARSWFAGKSNEELMPAVMRNSSLQGAYLMLAARALGLDCGPMSGFDSAGVDAAFFSGTSIRSNFIINLGYGKRETLYPRGPRLSFAEACQIL